jgi:hypothetical protein
MLWLAGEAQRAAATLYGHGMRARMLMLQGLFDTAASVAQKILLHPLASSSAHLKADAAGTLAYAHVCCVC